MNIQKIKQQLKDFRSTTPKHIQWLLLGAAFVVVIMLLTLVLSHKSNDNEKIESASKQVSFSAQPDKIDLTGVIVGETKNQNVTLTVNTPVVLDSVSIDTSDITTTNNCDNLADSCIINVIYKPNAPISESETTLKITWHILSQQDVLQTFDIPVIYDAVKKEEPAKKPEIVKKVEEPAAEKKSEVVEPVKQKPVEEKPVEPESIIEDIEDDDTVTDVVIPDDNDDIEEPEEEIIEEPVKEKTVKKAKSEPVQKKIEEEIRSISKPNIFEEKIDDFVLPPEKCSDFAIPGYNQSGVQIGWIKPENGANYFHPFSDKDCSNPTGKYDFSTGLIISLEDGSRMGTDANHIGYRNVRMRGSLSMPNLSPANSDESLIMDGKVGDNAAKTTGRGPKLFSAGDSYSNEQKEWSKKVEGELLLGTADEESVTSSKPYDRTFILRQFKPIPATIVSEVRADPSVYGCDKSGQNCSPEKNHSVPVRATVDRNVYSDNGRTIIIPTGTLLMGYLDGELPGPYQAVGRMNIRWYQFIRPDGVEFNFQTTGEDPYSGDAQGRIGVPGHGSTDYIEQMVMPILTSLVPAAVNMIAPIADTVINQIDLDNNTIVQSGTMRSSEMAKQEVIETWNKVAQKLLVDVMANTTPPFSIAAGTRINVYSPVDLIVSCEGTGKKCDLIPAGSKKRRAWSDLKKQVTDVEDTTTWVGQMRRFNLDKFCDTDSKGMMRAADNWAASGYDYRTVAVYCESQNYKAINNAKYDVYKEQVQQQYDEKYKDDTKAYNQDILKLQYDDDGNIVNPFAKPVTPVAEIVNAADEALLCSDGVSSPDSNGCCPGETFFDNGPLDADNPDGPHEYVCCPADDPEGECFDPIKLQ